MLHHTGPGQDHRHTQPLPTPYPIPDLLNISHNQVPTTCFCETRNILVIINIFCLQETFSVTLVMKKILMSLGNISKLPEISYIGSENFFVTFH